jgi:hypothetical protein
VAIIGPGRELSSQGDDLGAVQTTRIDLTHGIVLQLARGEIHQNSRDESILPKEQPTLVVPNEKTRYESPA